MLLQGRSAYEAPDGGGHVETMPMAAPARAVRDGTEERTEARSRRSTGDSPAVAVAVSRQQHDSRGRPINPASRASRRALAEAQNDVLSLVGVCVRDVPNLEDLTASSRKTEMAAVELVLNENLYGVALRALGSTYRLLATWWIGSLRDRLLVWLWLAVLAASYYSRLSDPRGRSSLCRATPTSLSCSMRRYALSASPPLCLSLSPKLDTSSSAMMASCRHCSLLQTKICSRKITSLAAKSDFIMA